MAKPIDDRTMLIRTMQILGYSRCCDFFACPGPDHKPVPMASCGQATAAYELRNYLERHGGWCPEHDQNMDRCHPAPDDRFQQCPDGNTICYCNPVRRNTRNQKI
jgi:hypothetical protein